MLTEESVIKLDNATIDLYRKMLKRAAWRLQYKIRKVRKRELKLIYEYQSNNCSIETEILSKIYVNELIMRIPWQKCRYVIQRTIIDGMTEKDVAYELNITQQAVSKWKKKGLETIRQTLCNSCMQ